MGEFKQGDRVIVFWEQRDNTTDERSATIAHDCVNPTGGPSDLYLVRFDDRDLGSKYIAAKSLRPLPPAVR